MMQTATRNIDWSGVYMLAESNKEPFVDVRITTTKCELHSKLGDLMFATSSVISTDVINQLKSTTNITIPESVTVTADGQISVVMNADVIDDDATWRAIGMVADALDQLEGKPGTIQL